MANAVRRFLRLQAWRGTERIAASGGFMGARVGLMTVGRVGVLLEAGGDPVRMVPISRHPYEAALRGAAHLGPPVARRGSSARLAVDIGSTNMRAGLVALRLDQAPDLSRARAAAAERWRYAGEGSTRDEAMERLAEMRSALSARVRAVRKASGTAGGVARLSRGRRRRLSFEASDPPVADRRNCGSLKSGGVRAAGFERTPSPRLQAEAKTSRCVDRAMWFCRRPCWSESGSGMEQAAAEAGRGGCRRWSALAMAPVATEPRTRHARSADPCDATSPAKELCDSARERTDAAGRRKRRPPQGRADRRAGAAMRDAEKAVAADAYDRWAPVYDLVFGAVFRRGRGAAVQAAERVGESVLEVGVGTGLSLASYSKGTRLTGVDISGPMLRRAQGRVAKLRLGHVRGLAVMDAEKLGFPDACFDVVVAQYVVTAVPNPERALDEFVRVLRPGGEVVITSRVGAGAGLRGRLEKWLMPVTARLGWRTEFPWERYARWAAGSPAVRLVERRPIPPLGHFNLIRFAKSQSDAGRGMAGADGASRRGAGWTGASETGDGRAFPAARARRNVEATSESEKDLG